MAHFTDGLQTLMHLVELRARTILTSTEKAKGIWLGADHFSAQYRTKL
jgi:hypothetical protein